MILNNRQNLSIVKVISATAEDIFYKPCLNDYSMGLFYPIFVSVFAGMQVVQTERGDNIFAHDVQ